MVFDLLTGRSTAAGKEAAVDDRRSKFESLPEERREDFEEFLARVDRMGYPHVDETDNPAYKMFLGWHHDN